MVEPCMRMEGLSQIMNCVSVEGLIGAGKSTFFKFMELFMKENRMDATDPTHVDEDRPDKDYILIVEEPVDEWTLKKHLVDGEYISMLEMFYRNREEMSFPFQCYTFTTRLDRMIQRLKQIVPTSFPRRIHLVSERSLRGDKLFLKANVETTQNRQTMQQELYIYERFHDVICRDVLKRHNKMIYIPTPPSESEQRIRARDRVGESGIPVYYLESLNKGHLEMIKSFQEEGGRVYFLEGLKEKLDDAKIKEQVFSFMRLLCDDFKSN